MGQRRQDFAEIEASTLLNALCTVVFERYFQAGFSRNGVFIFPQGVGCIGELLGGDFSVVTLLRIRMACYEAPLQYNGDKCSFHCQRLVSREIWLTYLNQLS